METDGQVDKTFWWALPTHTERKKNSIYCGYIIYCRNSKSRSMNRAIFCVYGLRHYCYFISIHCCHCHNDRFLNRARNIERFTKSPLHWFPKCNFARNDSSFALKCLNHWKRAISPNTAIGRSTNIMSINLYPFIVTCIEPFCQVFNWGLTQIISSRMCEI